MRLNSSNVDRYFSSIPVSKFWSEGDDSEIKMHKIHSYPAKFPSLVVEKSLKHASKRGVEINKIADIFCGCGTTALEAQRNELDFWGCDINPVATLISKVKSKIYSKNELKDYFGLIQEEFSTNKIKVDDRILNHERINYWFEPQQIQDLYKLLKIINKHVEKEKYRDFFLCAFSNILKRSSRWLTKSIKPQVDPEKPVFPVLESFENQVFVMIKANDEAKKKINSKLSLSAKIETQNFLDLKFGEPITDMVITSPPYVTSYEYADLHQLSTLWLGYVNDYRDLREGTIGSLYHTSIKENDLASLPSLGRRIISRMEKVDSRKSEMIAKYFYDIKCTTEKVLDMLNHGGLAVFVIGNTRYSNVKVDNARFLTHCMIEGGFRNIEVFKRKISSKILTPYRDKKGRFSSKKTDRKVYSHEFIVTGVK